MKFSIKRTLALLFTLGMGQSLAAGSPKITKADEAIAAVKHWVESKEGGSLTGTLDWQAKSLNTSAIKKECNDKQSPEGRHGWNVSAGDVDVAKKAKKLWRVNYTVAFWNYVTFVDPATGEVVLQFRSIEG